jgi:dimethylhistidine N-methyltransferase
MRTRPDSAIRAVVLPFADQPAALERVVHRLERDAAQERRALLDGLRSIPASIAPKYFYDALGCALFGAICELPEYYPTRTEGAIFTRHRSDIASVIGPGKQLVDLGAGDCAKAAAWLPFLAPSRYVAVDIAGDALRAALVRLAMEQPELDVRGVVADFTQGLDLAGEIDDAPVTFFYPGSSIGNFAPEDAGMFLMDIQRHCRVPGSGLLIGVDTRKDAARLEAAYADRLGVTAAFNRNVLLHVNRILGADFDPTAFVHQASYDAARGRIEMHLCATHDTTVHLDGVPRIFRAGERIHTENSFKYAPHDFEAILRAAGFDRVRTWMDDAGDFAVYYAS